MTRLIFTRTLAAVLCLIVLGSTLTGCGKKEEEVNPTATDAGKAAQYRSTYGAQPKSAAGGAARPSYGAPGGPQTNNPPGPAGH